MGQPRVTIFADCGGSIGVGHVMRSLALAEALTAAGAVVSWVAAVSTVPWLAESFWKRGIEVSEPPSGSTATLTAITDTCPSIVVIDSYADRVQLAQDLKHRDAKLVAIADESTPPLPADLYICPGIRADWAKASASRVIGGPEHVLIREDIRALRPHVWTPRPSSSPCRIALRLGGTDGDGAAPSLLAALRGLSSISHIDVSPDTQETVRAIRDLFPEASDRIELTQAGPDSFGRAGDADVVVTSGGVSVWEFACAGVPQVLVETSLDQRSNVDWFENQGCAASLGTLAAIQSDTRSATDRLQRLLADKAGLQVRARTAWERIDGKGAERAAQAIQSLAATQ